MLDGMRVIYDDGGRKAAGFRGVTGDCVVRAVAIASYRPYAEVWKRLRVACRGEREHPETMINVMRPGFRRLMRAWGARFRGDGGRLRPEKLQHGRLVVWTEDHVFAVIDGVIRDHGDVRADPTFRTLYGVWRFPSVSEVTREGTD